MFTLLDCSVFREHRINANICVSITFSFCTNVPVSIPLELLAGLFFNSLNIHYILLGRY